MTMVSNDSDNDDDDDDDHDDAVMLMFILDTAERPPLNFFTAWMHFSLQWTLRLVLLFFFFFTRQQLVD